MYDDKVATKKDAKVHDEGKRPSSSSARARVRAVYEARKARLQARRSCGATVMAPPTAKAPKLHRKHRDDKENMGSHPPSKSTNSSKKCSQKVGSKVATSTPFAKPHSNCACHSRTNKASRLLTPIKEVQENIMLVKSCPAPLLDVESAASTIEGDYVTLRTPESGDYVTLATTPQTPQAMLQSEGSLNNTSIWINSTDGLKYNTLELSAHEYSGSPDRMSRRESPVKYASSDTISELYTSTKSLKDVSQISRISHSSLREQVSGSNINSAVLQSSFDYPLHSTLNYPLHSTLNMSDITPMSQPNTDDLALSDARTTVSEPSALIRNRINSELQAVMTPRSMDDSWLDIRSLQKVEKKNNPTSPTTVIAEESPKTPKCGYSIVKIREGSAQLCKEHGLHPTLGGPCIFQTDDSFTLTESSLDEDDLQAPTSEPYTETDCDSSYLSECMDDTANFNQGLSAAEDYTATYDARNGRMKMLKRQTGQTALQNEDLRYPIGLSDSDFLEATRYLDATRKHFSLEATRSSLPDLAALDTTSVSEDDLDSTLRAAQNNNNLGEGSRKDSDGGVWSPNSLNETMVSMRSIERRPLSVSTVTTADTSPESNTGMQVPVNSPNVTDSTGSSSKQNTDTYDYVEVPMPKNANPKSGKLLPLPPRPPARKRHSSQRATKSSGSRSIGSRSIGSRSVVTTKSAGGRLCSTRSSAGSNRTRSSHDIRDRDSHSRHHAQSCYDIRDRDLHNRHHGCETGGRKPASPARRCLCYHHDCDSGFSTPASMPHKAAGCHITISDTAGHTRTVVQHSAVGRNLQKERKKAIVKKLKQFNNTFHKSTGNLQIQTLGHF